MNLVATNNRYLIPIFIIFIFVLDILNKFDYFEIPDSLGFLFIKAFKTFFIFLFFALISLKPFRANKSFYIFFLILFIIYLIGQISLYLSHNKPYFIDLYNLRYLALYFFPIIYVKYLNTYSIIDKRHYLLIENILIGIIALNTILILCGAFFEISFFKTYGKNRWGYMGLMPRSITASYLTIISIFYLYIKYNLSKKYTYLFWFVIAGALCIGTKSIYLFLILLFTYHFISNKLYKNYKIYIFLSLLVGTVVLFSNFILKNIVNNFFSIHLNLYKEKGFLTSLSSFRYDIFWENLNFVKTNWAAINYFFGGFIPDTKMFENSLADLIVFFGFGGAFLYLFYFWKNWVNQKLLIFKLFIFATFLISILAGQFFMNISAIAYFALMYNLLNCNKKVI